MTATKLVHPTIHTNGTSREALLKDYRAALFAIMRTIDTLHASAPNGRDYYPQGDAAFSTARAQHLARIALMVSVSDELETLALACMGEG